MKQSLIRSILPIAAGIALSMAAVAHAEGPACELTPLELPLFGGTPVAEIAVPATPTSTAAVDEMEIRAALEQFVACTNTGDPALVWAMFSPQWFATSFADPTVHYLPAFEQMLDNVQIIDAQSLVLQEIGEIVSLPDGRVDVTATFTSGDETWTDTLTLVKIDGDWLIDEVSLNTPTQQGVTRESRS